jgi:hypothetical protein
MLQVLQRTYADELFKQGAGVGTNKAVRKAIMNTIETLKPAPAEVLGKPVEAEKTVVASVQTDKVLAAIKKVHDSQYAGYISLIVVGETHEKCPVDIQRTNDLIAQIGAQGGLTPTFLIYERGMNYAQPQGVAAIAQETNLTTVLAGNFGLGLSAVQRSMVVAGYIFLCLAGGEQFETVPPAVQNQPPPQPQPVIDKVILFYGENHKDILDCFEYFARHSTANWLQNRPRQLVLIKSQC